MREILFRGQTRRKGEKVRLDATALDSNWVYGGVAQLNERRAMIYQTEPEFQKFTVYADTVGQYTGLTDKNNSKIFEGDIVELHFSGARGVVIFDKGCYMIEVHAFGRTVRNIIGEYDKDVLEIIGNIHDNPELLKGE